MLKKPGFSAIIKGNFHVKRGIALTEYEKLAQLLFGDLQITPEEYEAQYPARGLKEGARVTRFAPSPTGFLHIGGLFAAMIAQRTAQATDGVFFLRIEDTDKKREVEGGVKGIIDGLAAFGVAADEGMAGEDSELGAYGPYRQSARREIYRCFAKELVRQGLAYPCFCTSGELEALRQKQEDAGVNKGYYGDYAACRTLTLAQVEDKLRQGLPYVLRFRAQAQPGARITFDDMIKGEIELDANAQDVVLLKTDGVPTYHFAHVVDDHLMRTTHVVRGDEWIASVPVHLALFRACGFKPPKYAHIAPIMKEEDGGKRKLSKRKDPEAAVSYYAREGYPAQSVTEYLMTLANSNFEDWRRANPAAPLAQFPFNLKKMSASGALFDLKKLVDVSKNVIAVMPADEVYTQAAAWAQVYQPQLHVLLTRDPAYTAAIFAIDRGGKKPRKDIAKWSDVSDYTAYFFPEMFQPERYPLPDMVSPAQAAEILEHYLQAYAYDTDKDAWFARIKSICAPLGYAESVKEYKANPTEYQGHVGDVSSVIRSAVTARLMTPDLYEIMRLLGEKETRTRLERALCNLKGEVE